MAHAKLSEAELKKLFERFDMNGNGKLSLAEIDKAVVEQFPALAGDKRAIMRAYKATDQNNDGVVNFHEFHHLMDNLYYFNELGKAFAAADKDHDHRVSEKEFIDGHKTLGINEDDGHLKAEFAKIDTNHGGYIMFDEYCAYVAKKKRSAHH